MGYRIRIFSGSSSLFDPPSRRITEKGNGTPPILLSDSYVHEMGDRRMVDRYRTVRVRPRAFR